MKRVPIIEMNGISKRFPGVIANDNISFRVFPGEIHALLGENGAGKSTLMSILAGLYRPDSGNVRVKGEVMKFSSPRKALEAGVGMVYQHFRLVENLTVAENIVLGAKKPGIRINQKQIEDEARKLSDQFGLGIDPSAYINQLSLGEQQRVEILKMLYRGCDILIMDEPTTVLTPGEVTELFKVLRMMANEGKGVVMITHKLDEVMEIADYVTVLRRGQVVGDDHIENLSEQTLTRMMVERDVIYSQVNRQSAPESAVLTAENLCVQGDRGNVVIQDLNLDLRHGEILAIAGVAGNGQKELVEVLAGLRPVLSGRICFEEEYIDNYNVRQHMAMGIAMVPEDRIGMGLVPNLSVMDNAILRSYFKGDFCDGIFLNYRKIRSYTDKLVQEYNIFLSDPAHPVNYLSGGNLQKLLLGREIDQGPRVLLASYPVRGLDVAAAEAVYDIFLKEREKGTAILLVLEDLDDIFRIADRVAVMYEGTIKKVLNVADTSIVEIGALMVGAEKVGVSYAEV